jgi:hypothetical protein
VFDILRLISRLRKGWELGAERDSTCVDITPAVSGVDLENGSHEQLMCVSLMVAYVHSLLNEIAGQHDRSRFLLCLS